MQEETKKEVGEKQELPIGYDSLPVMVYNIMLELQDLKTMVSKIYELKSKQMKDLDKEEEDDE